jgi:hypothetical protein
VASEKESKNMSDNDSDRGKGHHKKLCPVNVRAIWNLKLSKFQVELNTIERRDVQMMTEQEYVDFCAGLDTEVRVGGWKLILSGDDGSAMKQIVTYLRTVLASYLDAKRRGVV